MQWNLESIERGTWDERVCNTGGRIRPAESDSNYSYWRTNDEMRGENMEIKAWKTFPKEERKKLKKFFKKAFKHTMPVPQKSLLEQSRYFYDDNEWDSYNEYGFLGYNLTDEEIKELVDEMWMRIYSPYDCTGKHFTLWINAHRNPSGLVSFVHRIGVDV